MREKEKTIVRLPERSLSTQGAKASGGWARRREL